MEEAMDQTLDLEMWDKVDWLYFSTLWFSILYSDIVIVEQGPRRSKWVHGPGEYSSLQVDGKDSERPVGEHSEEIHLISGNPGGFGGGDIGRGKDPVPLDAGRPSKRWNENSAAGSE